MGEWGSNTKVLQVRVSDEEKEYINRAAEIAGLTTSSWIRMQLRMAINRIGSEEFAVTPEAHDGKTVPQLLGLKTAADLLAEQHQPRPRYAKAESDEEEQEPIEGPCSECGDLTRETHPLTIAGRKRDFFICNSCWLEGKNRQT